MPCPIRPRCGAQRRVPALLALLAAASTATALAGCVATREAGPAAASIAARWAPWDGHLHDHLYLDVRNTGERTVVIGPGGWEVTVFSTRGTVPVVWANNTGGRELNPGERAELVLHPRVSPAGQFGLTLDPTTGVDATPPAGLFSVPGGDVRPGDPGRLTRSRTRRLARCAQTAPPPERRGHQNRARRPRHRHKAGGAGDRGRGPSRSRTASSSRRREPSAVSHC